MTSPLNKHRLNNLLRGIQTSIGLFESMGHSDAYFTAQFFSKGKKQNGITRGDLHSIGKQLRTYITSENADAARIEFFSEATGKSIYSKALTDLRRRDESVANSAETALPTKTKTFQGFGEAQVLEMVDRKLEELRRNDEIQRLNKEVDELRSKNAELTSGREELEEQIKAKTDLEFYSGILGTAFPGLITMLKGTPFEQAANHLSGISAQAAEQPKPVEPADEGSSIACLINEFCKGLDEQETGAIHLLFMAFEADRSKIHRALHCISTET